MIHIFFTKIDTAVDFSTYHTTVNKELTKDNLSFLIDKFTQVFFKDGQKELNFGIFENPPKNLEHTIDSILLIHDDLVISDDGINWFNEDSTIKNDIIKLISSHRECMIYFHENGFSRHETFLDWIKDDELNKIDFYYTKNNTVLTSSHIENSPFEKLIKIILVNNEKEFISMLNELKKNTFDSKNDIEGIDDLNQKLTFLHKLLGNQVEEAKKMNLYQIDEDLESRLNGTDKIEAIREIRDLLIQDVV